MAVTAATPAIPPTGYSPNNRYPGTAPDGQALPVPQNGQTYTVSPRVRFANWMERTFGRAYLPIAMVAGAAVGGGIGLMTLGPLGGVAGAAIGGLLAGAAIFSD